MAPDELGPEPRVRIFTSPCGLSCAHIFSLTGGIDENHESFQCPLTDWHSKPGII